MASVTLEQWGKKLERTLVQVTNAAAGELSDSMSRLTRRNTGRAAEGYFVTNSTGPGSPAFIVNNVPYIMVLNDGGPNRAGDNMIERAMQSFNPDLNRLIR